MVVGVKTAATLLGEWAPLPDVAPADVRELAQRGMLRVVVPGDWPLVELDAPSMVVCLPGHGGWPSLGSDQQDAGRLPLELVEELRRVGEARRAWLTASCGPWDAAEALGVSREEFELLAVRHGVRPGRFGRYRRPDVARLHRVLQLAGASAQEELAGGG
jgi:hypothetical protein